MTARHSHTRRGPAPEALTAFALTLLLGASLATAQESETPASETPTTLFGEVVDVRVINIEAVVTENGERVTGLGPGDFVLEVDGKEVPIEYFTEVHGGTAAVRGDETEVGTLPALAPGTPVPTSYLLFVDEFFTVAPRRNRVLDRLIEQLPVLRPEDRMAVVAYDGKKLEMLATWSQSVESLTRVLEKARERPAFGLQRRAEIRSFEATRELRGQRLRALTRDGLTRFQLNIEEEQEAERIASQVERVTLAAASALRGFANPPGRKVMLLLSGGWPYNPAMWVTGDLRAAGFTTTVPHGDELYGPLVETANRLSYTVYPVYVEYEGALTTDVEHTAFDAELERSLAFDRRQEEHAALNFVADDTGGKAMLGAARYAALERAAADTRTYYWLGFTPDWKGDDETHEIDLDVRRKGLKIRSRDSFSDLSRQTEVSMMVESSLLFGDAPSSQPLYAETGEPQKSGRGKVEVPLSVVIPVAELTFLPRGEHYLSEVELRVVVQDERGNLSDVPVIPMTVAMEEMPEEGELRRYDTAVRMRKRKHELVVSLYDVASGKILATRLEVDPKVKKK